MATEAPYFHGDAIAVRIDPLTGLPSPAKSNCSSLEVRDYVMHDDDIDQGVPVDPCLG